MQAAEALEVLQGRVRENTGEVGNLLFDRWTADELHELACLARDARDAKLEGFMRGEEVQPTGRITARIAGDQHAVDWDGIDPRLERRLSAVEKRYLAKRIGQNRANMAEDGRLQAARWAVQPGNPQVNLDRPAEELLDRDDVVLEVQAPRPAASQAKGRPWGPDGAMVDQSWHSIKDVALWPLGSYLEDDPQDRVYRSLGHREREVGPATQIRNLDWLHRLCNNDFVAGRIEARS